MSPTKYILGRGVGTEVRWLNYRELATSSADYVSQMGFTHVELLPVMEHPFYGSWGYQTTGYFAPTSRYGTPQDLHVAYRPSSSAGIGVILDWVPSHFPDEHGLAYFDGTHLYEHADPRLGFHPDWNSLHLQLRPERSSELSSEQRRFWLDQYHVDGLRVDAVASMLYRDYSRKAGEWIPNRFGGRENMEAVRVSAAVERARVPRLSRCQTMAEESTAWPMVSKPTYMGGLGFGFKWDMGWMHDTLQYMSQDAFFRKYHHHELTFRMIYAFNENFMLPLSHDEVVHGKGSLIARCRATTGRSSPTCAAVRLHVDAARQEAAVHGRRVRSVAGVESRGRAGLGAARPRISREDAYAARHAQSSLQVRTRPA